MSKIKLIFARMMRSMMYPFLFALFPILSIYTYNINEVVIIDLVLPILVTLVGTLILLLLLRPLTKNWNKAAIITILLLALFFSYGHIQTLLFSAGIIKLLYMGTQLALGLLWVFLFIAGTFLVIRTRKTFFTLTKFLNITATILVVTLLGTIGIHEAEESWGSPKEKVEEVYYPDQGNPKGLPDIYYIILDTYTRQDTLQEVFNYDNSEFINFLTDKGFYVASKSCSNYDYTILSIQSSLNMEYLKEAGYRKLRIIEDAIRHSKIKQFLENRGYCSIFVGGDADYIGAIQLGLVDICLTYKSGEVLQERSFFRALIHTTALSPLIWHFKDFFDNYTRNSRLYAFDKLADIPYIEVPTFTYSHIFLPHPPYVFDREGSLVRPNIWDVTNIWNPSQNEERYIDQLVFTNKKVEVLINEILARSDITPIIILQGDHGIWWREGKEWDILNAYYLPGVENVLYETISPVNSFRVILNLYFNADYELLEDESYESGLRP